MWTTPKFIHCICLLQVIVIISSARSINDVVENYSEIINKLKSQVRNFTDNTYQNCSDQIMFVLNNNTFEITETKNLLREMHSGKDKILGESGMSFFPQMIKECQEKFDQDSEELTKTISEAENVCLIFISNVFTLIENPELYKNYSDLQMQIDGIHNNCTNTSFVREAEDCFRKEIYVRAQSRIKEIKKNMHLFLNTVERKVNIMTGTIHRCYNTVRTEVLMKKVRKGIRNFQKCVLNKNMNRS